jgi:hypothetical protein
MLICAVSPGVSAGVIVRSMHREKYGFAGGVFEYRRLLDDASSSGP